MGGKFIRSVLIVLILIALATIVSGCPWDSDEDPSKVTPLNPTPDPDDEDDATPKPTATYKPYEPRRV